MEKLERILHAEDAARTAVTDASATAQRIVADARVRAAEQVRSSREETRLLAANRRDEVLGSASAEAAAFKDEASHDAEAILAQANERTTEAVAAVLGAVEGRS